MGSAIAAVVAATGLVAWPELVPALTLCLSSVELSAVEGGLDALYQVRPHTPVLQLAQGKPTPFPPPPSEHHLSLPSLSVVVLNPVGWSQVCEDAPAQLEVRLSVSVPSASAVLVPELLRLLKSSHNGVRSGVRLQSVLRPCARFVFNNFCGCQWRAWLPVLICAGMLLRRQW